MAIYKKIIVATAYVIIFTNIMTTFTRKIVLQTIIFCFGSLYYSQKYQVFSISAKMKSSKFQRTLLKIRLFFHVLSLFLSPTLFLLLLFFSSRTRSFLLIGIRAIVLDTIAIALERVILSRRYPTLSTIRSLAHFFLSPIEFLHFAHSRLV